MKIYYIEQYCDDPGQSTSHHYVKCSPIFASYDKLIEWAKNENFDISMLNKVDDRPGNGLYPNYIITEENLIF